MWRWAGLSRMIPWGVGKEERSSFLKKRTKRLFLVLSRFSQAAPTICKSLLLLFFRKEDLPSV
jgi:hypothetical protein